MVKKLQKNKAKKVLTRGERQITLKIKLTEYFSTAYQKDSETVCLKG